MASCYFCETEDENRPLSRCYRCDRTVCDDDLFPGYHLQLRLVFNGRSPLTDRICLGCRTDDRWAEEQFDIGPPPLDDEGGVQSGVVFTPKPLAHERLVRLSRQLENSTIREIRNSISVFKQKTELANQLLHYRQAIQFSGEMELYHKLSELSRRDRKRKQVPRGTSVVPVSAVDVKQKQSAKIDLSAMADTLAKSGMTLEQLVGMLKSGKENK